MPELLLATAGEDVRLWTMPDLRLHSARSTSGNTVKYCTCSNNGQFVAYANEGQGIHISTIKSDNTNDVWEIPTAWEQSNVAFSNSSRFVAGGGKDGVVNVWDMKSRTLRRTFRNQINPVSFCVVNFNDKIVASSSDQGEIILNELSSGLASDPLLGMDTETINCLQYSHFTHNLLASAGGSGAVNLWDTSETKLLRTFAEHTSSSTCLSFSPLNDMLLSSTGLDKRIIFYDVCYKKIVKTISTKEPLTCCDFLHDGTTIAVGAASGHIFLFDLRHGATPLKVIPAHRTSVRSTSFQKLLKEKSSKRQLSPKVEKSVSTSSIDSKPQNIETPMEGVSSAIPFRHRLNLENLRPEQLERFQPRDKSCRLNSDKSIENLQTPHSKYPELADEFFSPLEVGSCKKQLKKSKSGRKKFDLSSKHSSLDNAIQVPSMLGRSKSCLTRLSLYSRSAGDLSKTTERKIKENKEFRGVIERSTDVQKDTVDGKKGLFKLSFRKKKSDKPSDESETSAIESVSIDDKTSLRGNKSLSSIRSNNSDLNSTASVPPSSSKPTNDHKQVISDINDVTDVDITDMKLGKTLGATAEVDISPAKSESSEKFQIDFVQRMIDEATEDNRIFFHRTVMNLQVEFIRQMEIQEEHIRQMVEYYSINEDLVFEIQRLRAENEILKRIY